jgi:septum formation protein
MNWTDKIILMASKSPRRRQLLELAGIPFELRSQDVDEDFPENMPAKEVAPYLAQKKARAAVHLLESDRQILLTADSVVILDGRIFNKPADRGEAQNMLGQLSGRRHTVITGVCLRSRSREEVLSGVSQVYFNTLTKEEIDFYIDQYQPFDKAGSYAIQEWIGLCKIKRIEGTYANIMGLPVDLVYEALGRF